MNLRPFILCLPVLCRLVAAHAQCAAYGQEAQQFFSLEQALLDHRRSVTNLERNIDSEASLVAALHRLPELKQCFAGLPIQAQWLDRPLWTRWQSAEVAQQ